MTTTLVNKILNYYRSYYKDSLGIPNWKSLTNNQLKEDINEAKRINDLEKLLGPFKNKKILDVGCGTGGFVVSAANKCAKVVGLEPDEKALEVCLLKQKESRLKNAEFLKGVGEKMPFNKEEFDIVHSLTVLEHVENVEKSITEMARVTKKGGMIYIKTPNYLSFYEGHYKLFWLPKFPKFLAKIYLKIRKRPPKFIDTINYVTPGLYKSILVKHNLSYKFTKQDIKKNVGLINLVIFIYQKVFNISQNIEVIITK